MSHYSVLFVQRHRRAAQRGLQPQADVAKLRRLIRADGDIGGVEDLDIIERGEEGGGGIAHIVAHTAGPDAEAVGGARDVADQPVLVAAGDGHAGAS